jgi:hypothetical protein
MNKREGTHMKKYVQTMVVVAVLTCLISPQRLQAEDVFKSQEIVLYNQMDEFELRSPSAEVLAEFIKKLDSTAAVLWEGMEDQAGQRGLIAVAIRPDRTMKLWVDIEGKFQPEITARLEQNMKTFDIPHVRIGAIAFAVHFDLWGGASAPKVKTDEVEIPEVWRKKLEESQKKRVVIPNDILPLAWDVKEGEESDGNPMIVPPDGFSVQKLSPLGGEIYMPDGWFYTEGHRENAFMWTVAKENPADGPYDTGVRIQCFVGVHDLTGKSPEEFVKSFVDKKKAAGAVISVRPEQKQGLFTRIGLEIEESRDVDGKEIVYRILYSCFWGEGADIAVVSISGAPVGLWEQYKDTFNIMSGVKLVDMAQLEEAQKNAEWKEIENSSDWRRPPSGYEWVECKAINSAFLKPSGWHFITLEKDDGFEFTILQEPVVSPTAIGMTIDVIKDCRKNKGVKPTEYHARRFSEYTQECEVLSVSDPIEQEDLTIYRAEVNKVLADNVKYRVLFFGIANDETDTLQIIKYTCPLEEWEDHESIAIPMLQNLIINENL